MKTDTHRLNEKIAKTLAYIISRAGISKVHNHGEHLSYETDDAEVIIIVTSKAK